MTLRPPSPAAGFTLLEVLVALVITGLTVTTFLQLMGSGVRLEVKSKTRTESAVAARRLFDRLLEMDIREDEFPWTGQQGDYAWTVTMKALAIQQPKDNFTAGEIYLALPYELYEVGFDLKVRGKQFIHLARVISQPASYFEPDFKDEYIQLPEGLGAFPAVSGADGAPNTGTPSSGSRGSQGGSSYGEAGSSLNGNSDDPDALHKYED